MNLCQNILYRLELNVWYINLFDFVCSLVISVFFFGLVILSFFFSLNIQCCASERCSSTHNRGGAMWRKSNQTQIVEYQSSVALLIHLDVGYYDVKKDELNRMRIEVKVLFVLSGSVFMLLVCFCWGFSYTVELFEFL